MNDNPNIHELPPYAMWAFGVAALGWLIGPFLGYRFGLHSQKASRRMLFRNQMLVLISKLQDTDDEGVNAFYVNTRGTVIEECAKIALDISWWKRGRFKSASAAYQHLKRHEIEESIKDIYQEQFLDSPDLIRESHQKRMNDALTQLSKCC